VITRESSFRQVRYGQAYALGMPGTLAEAT